jgi:hypothetical protein
VPKFYIMCVPRLGLALGIWYVKESLPPRGLPKWSKHIPILAPILNILFERHYPPIDERQGYYCSWPILGEARGGMMARRLSMRSTRRLAWEGSNEKRRATIFVAEIVRCVP